MRAVGLPQPRPLPEPLALSRRHAGLQTPAHTTLPSLTGQSSRGVKLGSSRRALIHAEQMEGGLADHRGPARVLGGPLAWLPGTGRVDQLQALAWTPEAGCSGAQAPGAGGGDTASSSRS